nr:hypothetical protein Iba_chr05dCG11250 [Ipomoea batatas]
MFFACREIINCGSPRKDATTSPKDKGLTPKVYSYQETLRVDGVDTLLRITLEMQRGIYIVFRQRDASFNLMTRGVPAELEDPDAVEQSLGT